MTDCTDVAEEMSQMMTAYRFFVRMRERKFATYPLSRRQTNVSWDKMCIVHIPKHSYKCVSWYLESLRKSLRVPSLKFVGLAIRQIWRTMCVSINGPGDFDLWPFDLETGVQVAAKVGNLRSEFGHARPSGSRVICYVRDGRTTDGQTDGRTKAKLTVPFPTAGA